MKTIGIVGLGVMGASFAGRLKEKGYTIYGFDILNSTIETALETGILTKGTIHPRELLSECDTIIICLYPSQILNWIEKYQDVFQEGCRIFEISGVKTGVTLPIQKALRKDVELVSIHPMCGRESRGIEHSDTTIFDGANYIIIPTSNNTPEGIRQAHTLGEVLGVKNISELTIEKHDRMIGFLSQLTHVIAVSLMNTHVNSHLVEYTGDSFRDLTRIAEINEDLWTELFLLNKRILLDETDQFITAIQNFRDVLAREDTTEMRHLFRQSTRRRQRFKKSEK